MPNPISTLRDALQTDLAAQFPAAEVLSGTRESRSVDKDRISLLWVGATELPGDVVVSSDQFAIRFYPGSPKLRPQAAATSGARDPEELEQAAFDLQDYLQTRQVSYPSAVWFLRVISVTPNYDPEEWYVEASVLAQRSNPAVL
jgi:hypothetical protein